MGTTRPEPGSRDSFKSKFDAMMPPMLAQNMTAKNYVDALKESRWNCDFQNETYKHYLGVAHIDDIMFSEYKCSIASAFVIRYILPEFIESKGWKIDRIATLEGDGEYPPSFSSIELGGGKVESRLVYGNYFISNATERYIIHLQEGYHDDFQFLIASKRSGDYTSVNLSNDMVAYAESHNFLKGKKIDPSCKFITFDKVYSWDDLILPEAIKNKIRQNLMNLIESTDIYKSNGLQLKRGIILSGKPGTGKTQLFKILCNQIDWTVLWVTPKHLESAKKVSQIVGLAKDLAPTIMLLEDIDLYGGSRESNHNPALLGEMMNQLDGVQDNTDIITIATTNNKDVLEKALLNRPGRFDITIDFPLPDDEERKKMLKIFSNGLLDSKAPFFDKVCKEYSKDMTGAQVRELVNMAVILAIDSKSYDANKKLTLTEQHFDDAIKAVKSKDFSRITGFAQGASSPTGIDFDDLDD